MSTEEETPIEIDVHSVKSLLDANEDFFFVDCREKEECDLVSIQGTTHIPMGEISERVGDFSPYREKRVVVHCHLGGRSMMVTQWLRQQGFAKAQNMTGGIDAWSLAVDSSLPRYE